MNEITLRYQFTGAGTSPAYRVTIAARGHARLAGGIPVL